jgi:hypothetical protein
MNTPKVTVANVVGAITLAGIAGQAASYLAATAYYSHFGISPEQLSITPLNAFGRLFYTGSLAAAVMIAVFGSLLLYSARKRLQSSKISLPYSSDSTQVVEWNVKESFRHKKLATVSWNFEDVNQLNRFAKLVISLMIGTASLVLFLFLAHLLGDQAGRVAVDSNYESLNPVRADLIARPMLYRWTKVEETPTLLFTTKTETFPDYMPIRSGLLIGIGNGTTYIFDDRIKKTIAVPSSQVQLAISAF